MKKTFRRAVPMCAVAASLGLAGPGPGVPSPTTPLIEHWNGKAWKVVPSPNPPSDYLNVLLGVAAVSRDDIWAVGSTDYESTLVAHWNGRSWN